MKIRNQPQRFQDFIHQSEAILNASLITVTAARLDVVVHSTFNVVAGQWLRIGFDVRMAKGVTAGSSEFVLISSGTATVESKGIDLLTRNLIWQLPDHAASIEWSFTSEAWLHVILSGTILLRIRASSAGSDGTIAAAGAHSELVQFR